MPKIFISSVAKGLEGLREEIAVTLRKALFDVIAMEEFGAQPEPSIDVCLKALRQADAAVLVIGPRYGSLLPEQISFTHAEFREARGLGIPILAFKIPWALDLPTSEQGALDDFLTEVGSALTYDALKPGENEARLVAKVVAAVSAAQSSGRLGRQYSLFQPWSSFFAAQLDPSGASVSHQVPFVGREAPLTQLVEFFRGDTPLAFLVATGGSGKSRLLLEAARRWSESNEPPVLRFVDAGATWDVSDIRGLPAAPTVLIVDDAHRRPDLDRLLAACRLHNSEIRFVVSCRPSALETVRSLVASVSSTNAAVKIDLPPLDKVDAVRLAALCLGDRGGFAERLVRIADRNPLVISVGGRLIADNRVAPELLDASEEVFKAAVLDRLLDDPALQGADLSLRARILEIIAAVGPVAPEGDDVIRALATQVRTNSHDVRRHLARLEKSGFLLRRGRLIRANPDVLADHLLYRAAIDDNGRATGFVEAMLTVFPELLDNVLANAAELDWRGSQHSGHTPVLSATWRDIRALVPSMTHRQRADLLKKLKRAAVFAPGDVLTVAQQIAHSSDAPPDPQLEAWGFEDDPGRVVDALVEVFGFIAGHADFTRPCIDELWRFATTDERSVGPHPGHPRRKLEDLLKYEWRSQWQLPHGVQSRAIEALLARLQASDRPEYPWAVELLDKALGRLGDATESTRRQLTVSQFSLTSFLPDIRERRRRLCEALKTIAVGRRPAEAGAAVRALGELLKRPWGPFGQELKPDEITQWQPEAETAVSFLGDIAMSAALQAVRFIARRELRQAPRQRWPAIAGELDRASQGITPEPDEDFYEILAGLPWGESYQDVATREKRVQEASDRAAERLWHRYQTPHLAITTLLAGRAALKAVGWRDDSDRLIRSLVALSAENAEGVVRELQSSGEAGWALLPSALLAFHRSAKEAAEAFAVTLARSDEEVLRVAALDAIQWMLERARDAASLIVAVRELSQDESMTVRTAVPQVLRRLRTISARTGLEILVGIDWRTNKGMAAAVLECLHPEYGLDPKELSDSEVDTLIGRIAGLESIEQHHILEFVAFASARRPRVIVEALLRRIREVDDHPTRGSEMRWTPIPYNGHGLRLSGLAHAPDYADLLRMIRDSFIGASAMQGFWIPTLFERATSTLETGLEVLCEWVDSDNNERIVGAATLFGGFHYNAVFSQHPFIADLLDAASRGGPKCLEDASSALYSAAVSGSYSGVAGEPMPRHVFARYEGRKLSELYSTRTPARDLYAAIAEQAENAIKRHRDEWDEEGDE